MKSPSHIVLLLSAVLTVMVSASGNSALGEGVMQDSLANEDDQAIFNDVQLGISTANVGLFARYFAPQVGISLRGDEEGTFSSKQAYYVLVNFFRTRKFGRLQFSTIDKSDSTPYATGSVEFIYKGTKARAQVYVALMIEGRKHVISQLSIY